MYMAVLIINYLITLNEYFKDRYFLPAQLIANIGIGCCYLKYCFMIN